MVGVIDAPDACDRVEPGACESRRERRFELGPGVEHRRREHVAGDPAEGIKLDVHGCYSKPGAGTAHSGSRASLRVSVASLSRTRDP